MTRHSSSRSTARAHARTAAVAGSLLAIALASSATVLAADAAPSVRVSYAGLDLKSEQGARILYRRISAAAEQVCPSADPRALVEFSASRACRAQAVARAIQEVGNPKLAAMLTQHPTRS